MHTCGCTHAWTPESQTIQPSKAEESFQKAGSHGGAPRGEKPVVSLNPAAIPFPNLNTTLTQRLLNSLLNNSLGTSISAKSNFMLISLCWRIFFFFSFYAAFFLEQSPNWQILTSLSERKGIYISYEINLISRLFTRPSQASLQMSNTWRQEILISLQYDLPKPRTQLFNSLC